jgi:hypothetical protein
MATGLDRDFLEQLPPDLRAELEEQHSRESRGREEDGGRADRRAALDPEVLAALPEDLRAEVLATHRGTKPAPDGVRVRTAFDQLMGPKKLSPVKPSRGKRGRKKGSVNSTVTKKPQPRVTNEASNHTSDVDMEVFNALPEELKKEVEEQMQQKPRARRPLASRKVLFEDTSSCSKVSLVTNTENTLDTSQDATALPSEPAPARIPQFCGQTEVSGVRPLLKAWLASAAEPLPHDVQLLGDFLKDLVLAGRLETVPVLLRCLHRNIARLGDAGADGAGVEGAGVDGTGVKGWRRAWVALLGEAQAVTVQLYGKPLRLEETF